MQTNTTFHKTTKTRNNGDYNKRTEEKRKQLEREKQRKNKRSYE